METQPRLTDLQYYIYECGVTVDETARRIGTTNIKILEELARTPLPPWFDVSMLPSHLRTDSP